MSKRIRLLYMEGVSPLRSQTVYHAVGYAMKQDTPNTIIMVSPNAPYVCVGYHQDIQKEVDLDYCEKHNLPVYRREVGGGAEPRCEDAHDRERAHERRRTRRSRSRGSSRCRARGHGEQEPDEAHGCRNCRTLSCAPCAACSPPCCSASRARPRARALARRERVRDQLPFADREIGRARV